MTDVAVIMATYNGAKYIREQIDSILNNSYKDFELFIFDDGSNDDTMRIIGEYVEKNPQKVHFVQNTTNVGVIKNFVSAICQIEANYYLFCDQDDYWNSYKIEHTIKAIKEEDLKDRECPVVLYGDLEVVDRQLNKISESFYKHGNIEPKKIDLPHLLMENKFVGCTMAINHAVKRYLSTDINGMRMHDWWIGLIGVTFGKVVYLDESLLKYRQSGNNTVGSSSDISYTLRNLNAIGALKKGLVENCHQARAFFDYYGGLIPEDKKDAFTLFGNLQEYNWIKRRYIVIKHGYLKTGFLKNLAIFILI